MSSRRNFLKKLGAASTVGLTGTAALSGTAAAAKPGVDWEAAHSSNYTAADRGAGKIDWIVIHTVQGSASSAVNWFQDPDANVSAHYTVAESGYLYQSLADMNIGWHAGGSNYNDYSIGIEHGGYVSETYEDAQYRKSADLCAYLCEQYGVPKQHPGSVPYDAANPANGGIIAHSQVPESTHTDPGANWDWDYFIDLVNQY
ncbi:N-acetylmuramoyl-L-alanine amidase [Halorussus gelatinilyticus]|uniref:N-acetylmuramoyl-L-alanine amidase n=1 Tax=Halorussus gelatinilyticus TaxID=2937524 RepID=A0A8U0IFU2_9EURY|nr:peptidoglycan recognition family protein [Halorussus gelatinilyticus]UPV99604.1 N-acetylmuramoyl-L-alanine amidase [Halorussus gelatinilyticus]